MGKRRAKRERDDEEGPEYDLADMMSGRAPLGSGVDREAAARIIEEMGGPDAIDWEDLERCEAAILAREDQRIATGMDALRVLDIPNGISTGGMAEYLDSKGALPGRHDMSMAITIRLIKEHCGRLPRRRKD